MISRRTHAIITGRDDIEWWPWGGFAPEGKYGFCVGCIDETPSGWPRTRILVSTAQIYDTQEDAETEAYSLVAELRNIDTYGFPRVPEGAD